MPNQTVLKNLAVLGLLEGKSLFIVLKTLYYYFS